MSAKVSALVWEYYNPAPVEKGGCGAPLVLALALADEADDNGGGIFQSVPTLAAKTRQTERAIFAQLGRMVEAKALECVQKSVGGAGRFSQYRLNIATIIVLKNPERGSGITMNEVQGFSSNNPEAGSGFLPPHIEGLKEKKVQDSENPERGASQKPDADDEKQARWMLGRIRRLNPKHREPSWLTWLRDIRLMRERDGRTHREISELFAWANDDAFWSANILSPGKLREKWDQLTLQRRTKGGAVSGGLPGDSAKTDWRCVGIVVNGRPAHLADNPGTHPVQRCASRGTWQDPQGRAWCPTCRDARERSGARAFTETEVSP